MTDPRAEAVLRYWFGELKSDEDFPLEKARMWFQEGSKVDGVIREHFGADLEAAIGGELDGWAKSPRGLLALIIVLDQFSRNVYRDKPQSFAQDEKSLDLSLWGIAEGKDQKLRPVERVFLYMPLMHAESRRIQNKSVRVFTRLAENAPPAVEIPLRTSLDFATRHANIVERFGRFPYRNAVLKRASTPEEEAYLSSTQEEWV